MQKHYFPLKYQRYIYAETYYNDNSLTSCINFHILKIDIYNKIPNLRAIYGYFYSYFVLCRVTVWTRF